VAGARLFPVTVINVPTGADFGLKSVMAGCPPAVNVIESDCVVVFPATSVATTGMVFAPETSVTEQLKALLCRTAAVPLHVVEAIPERASEAVPVSCTVAVLTVELLAGEAMVNDGGVLSILRETEVLALLPALSVAVPLTTWLAPSVVTVTGAGHVATPEELSVQVNVTVTFVLFHPAALDAGETWAVITGGTLSVLALKIWTAICPPGLPRICTEMVLVACNRTALTRVETF